MNLNIGSPNYQKKIFNLRIKKITKHLKLNPNDNHCKLGLTKLISKLKKIKKFIKR